VNRQFSVGYAKYVIVFDLLFIDHVMWRMRRQLQSL